MDSLFKDLRYALRNLLRNPGFTAVAVISLALGIGANTAIFSFIDTVLLRDLPVKDPQRLVIFGEGTSRGVYGGPPDGPMQLFSWEQFQNFRKNNSVFEDVVAVNSRLSRLYVTLGGENSEGTPEPANADAVSGNFFSALGVAPAAGRFFDASVDASIGASPVVVLSDGYWARYFHRSESAIGRVIRIGGAAYTVIGVAPRGFFGLQLGQSPDLWIPASMVDTLPGASMPVMKEPLLAFLHIVARMKPGVTLAQANANVNVLYHQMLPGELTEPRPEEVEGIRHASVKVTPGSSGILNLRSRYEIPLRILMIVVAMVLLIACANVANLQLSLAAKRQKEFALRYALGAGRGRIVRQLLTESVLLALCGGVLGLLFANGAGKLLVHLISTGAQALPIDFNLDLRVLAVTVVLSLTTGILFGLAPAVRASRTDLNSSLKESKASMASPRKVTLGRILVSGQVALSLGLLITAGILLHSFSNLLALSTGFDRQSVLLFKLDSEASGYKEDARIQDLYRRIEDAVQRLPGVAAEGVSMFSFNEGQRYLDFKAPGVNLPGKALMTSENYVSPGYFSTLHIPLIAGRALSTSDTAAAEPAAVVTESFATGTFGSTAAALGRTIAFGDDEKKLVRIVGVARDIKVQSVRDTQVKMAWVSLYQFPSYMHTLAVRVSGDPGQVATAVRRTIQNTERNLPIRWTTTLADEVSDSLVRERAIAQLSTFFAALALLLAAVGLYGTISFAVARRTTEIGIRMALGAKQTGVLGMVLRDAMMLVGAGVLLGVPLALAATRQLQSLLYGIGTVDIYSVMGSVAALAAVAAIAGYLPARRAASVDPMVALRHE
jgi:predicted permease